jgi:hypothetical protein
MNVAGRVFAKGAFTPSVGLETMTSVRSAIQKDLAKQMMKMLKK